MQRFSLTLLDEMRPPCSVPTPYRNLAVAVIAAAVKGNDGYAWLRDSAGARFWAAVAGIDHEALCDQLRPRTGGPTRTLRRSFDRG
jgi:hypothetical protein